VFLSIPFQSFKSADNALWEKDNCQNINNSKENNPAFKYPMLFRSFFSLKKLV